MIFDNFESKDAQQLLQDYLDGSVPAKRFDDHVCLNKDGDKYTYDCAGRKRCWICTMKHYGSAVAVAVELHRYPHNFARVVGDLYQAYSECPSKEGRVILEDLYSTCLDTGKVPVLDDISKKIYQLYKEVIES
jgi:hypothetical protein